MKILLALLLGCASVAAAQSFTFRTISFDGASQYSQQQLLSMSGLTPGNTISQAELDSALHKLDDTGLFTSIDYKSEGPVLHITLVPMAGTQARTLHFQNFVLDTPQELDAKVRTRVPLFTGTIPISGDLQGKVERALESILKDEGIQATVTSIGGPNGVLNYSIASPPVVVGSPVIAGVDFALSANLKAIRGRFEGQDYLDQLSGQSLASNLLDAYQDLGYVDFSIGPIAHSKPVVSARRITVDLTGIASPGALYHVARLDLPTPAPGVSPAEIAAAAQLKPGGPASRFDALSTEAHVGVTFESHGYLDQQTTIQPHKDTAAHTVGYSVTTQPGERYTFRALTTAGVNPSAAQSENLAHALKLAPGAPMESSAVGELMRSSAARALCGGAPAAPRIVKNTSTHQADVVLNCPAPH